MSSVTAADAIDSQHQMLSLLHSACKLAQSKSKPMGMHGAALRMRHRPQTSAMLHEGAPHPRRELWWLSAGPMECASGS